MELIESGHSEREIERLTGVPRGTVNAWREGRGVSRHRRLARARASWRPSSPATYAYLLGVYLGDGHIVIASAQAARLVITLDASYPRIVREVAFAMQATFPEARVRTFLRMNGSCVAVQTCDPAVPYAFPQHGAGRKHHRVIDLQEWQLEITRTHAQDLIRGLVHSDGCRTRNRFRVKLPSGRVAEYEYPRYFFSNLSADIRRIFCDHCELLGIRWSQSNPRNISVSHRDSVARLDEFIGPKS